MLKLKLQYFGHLMQRADSREKELMRYKRQIYFKELAHIIVEAGKHTI